MIRFNMLRKFDSQTIARKIVNELLGNRGLSKSTWRDNNPEAYDDLISYSEDIQLSIERIVENERSKVS